MAFEEYKSEASTPEVLDISAITAMHPYEGADNPMQVKFRLTTNAMASLNDLTKIC